MKFSREYRSEAEAQAREQELLALGYVAWRTQKADGTWEVFWWTRVDDPLSGVSKFAA